MRRAPYERRQTRLGLVPRRRPSPSYEDDTVLLAARRVDELQAELARSNQERSRAENELLRMREREALDKVRFCHGGLDRDGVH